MTLLKKISVAHIILICLATLVFSAPEKNRIVIVEGDIVKLFEFNSETKEFDSVWESAETGTGIKSETSGIRGIALEDMDGDGRKELVAMDQFGIFVWGKHGKIPAYYSFMNAVQRDNPYVLPFDLDHDGMLELVLQRSGDPFLKTRRVEAWKIEGTEFVKRGEIIFPSPISWSLRAGDCDNDKKDDIITSDELIRILGWEENRGLFEIASFPNNSNLVDMVRIVDIDGDGQNEIIASGNGGCFTVYAHRKSLHNNSIAYPVIFQSDYLSGYTQGLEIADIDRDGKNEILVGVTSNPGQKNDNIFVFEQAGEYKGGGRTYHLAFRKAFSMPLESSAIPGFATGDADNDGQIEVVYNNKHILKFRRDDKKDLQCNVIATLSKQASASLIGPFEPSGKNESFSERIIPRNLNIDQKQDETIEAGGSYNLWATIVSPWKESRNVRISIESDTDKIKFLRGQFLLPVMNAGVLYDNKSAPFQMKIDTVSEVTDFVLTLHIESGAGYSISQSFKWARSSDNANFNFTAVPNLVVTTDTLAISTEADIFKGQEFPHDYFDSRYGMRGWPELAVLLRYRKLLIKNEWGEVLFQQKDKLKTFLDKGGNVLLHGNEALTILGRDQKTVDDAKQFAEAYVRARSLEHFEGKGAIQGRTGDVISDGLAFALADRGAEGMRPSVLEALPGAIPILFYADGSTAAVMIENKYRLVCLGFNVSDIQDEGIRKTLVKRILAWFDKK